MYTSHRTHGAYLAKGGDLGPHAVRDALPHQRLRRLARRLDAPHRQVGRHGRHLRHRRRRRSHRDRCGARRKDEAGRSRRRGVHRRCDDRRRRDGRKPQLRGAEEAAGDLLLRKQFLFGAVAARHAPACRATSAPGPRRTGCRRWRWTASTFWPCTMRFAPRSRGREPATVRRSSRSRSIAFARTAAPATTARRAIAPRPSESPGRRSIRFRCSAST